MDNPVDKEQDSPIGREQDGPNEGGQDSPIGREQESPNESQQDSPIDGEQDSPDDGEVVASEIGEALAVLISMVMTVVGAIFAMDMPDVKHCPKCPFMRESGQGNYTIEFYKCVAQRDFLENMWSSYVATYWSVLSIVLAGCSVVVGQIASPVVFRLVKHTIMATIVCLLWYVTEFQYHFESVLKLTAYVKSVLIVYLWILPLVFIMAVSPDGRPRILVKACVMCIGSALIFHLGLSGYNMFCGRVSRPLAAFLVFYFFFVSKLAMNQEVPFHVSLAMCLLVVPPICPMSVLLLCWCFDIFWTETSSLVPRVRDPPQQQQSEVRQDRDRYDRMPLRNGYRLRNTFRRFR